MRILRKQRSLTTRRVAEWSRIVARELGSPEFALSHARLVQLENGRSAPSIQKLFSLAVIYGVAVRELLGIYVNLEGVPRLHNSLGFPNTHIVSVNEGGSFLEHILDPRFRYGLIGLEDHTMDPLLRPGSMVLIDESDKLPRPGGWSNEFDRPIYFLETRPGYLCSWCDIGLGQLISIPHPLSPCRSRSFLHPRDVDVIGRVIAVAGRIGASGSPDIRA